MTVATRIPERLDRGLKDRADWSIWLDLALVSTGSEQRRARAAALKLNPLSPEIASFFPGAGEGS
jgi:hypothetical protein